MIHPRAAALIEELRSAVGDERVLAAIAAVPREAFVGEELREQAYENVALPIGAGQTISQPLVVARMLALLAPEPADRALDVGTGSGYHAALLASLCAHVWTIERHVDLSARAQAVIEALGIRNVTFAIGDGTNGLPATAPFDIINVAAAAPAVPEPLLDQLAPGGRLIIPEGHTQQRLVVVRRTPTGLTREQHDPVRFVPLVHDPPTVPDDG